MGEAGPIVLLVGGSVLVGVGATITLRSMRRLRRAGAFGSLYWRSFRHFAGYRLRTLRPLGATLVGLALVGAGLLAVYAGVTSFYSTRLGHLST
jgi:hypothetical protein